MLKPNVFKIIDYVTFIIIAISAIFLFWNHSYFLVPDPDIFQYIDDGKQYIQFRLPKNIQTPPINSILVCSLAQILKHYNNPEILSAHLINISAAIFMVIIMFLIIRRFSSFVGFLLVLLVVTNPLYIFQSLNVTSEVLFSSFVVLTFFLYQQNKRQFAYSIAGISFLVRYEAILLLISIFLIDLIEKRSFIKTMRRFIIGAIPVILWVLIINFHNIKGNVFGNEYIQEVLRQKQRIPQFGMIIRLPFLMADYFSTTTSGLINILGMFVLYGSVCVGVITLLFGGDPIFRLIFLTVLLYTIFHIFFPYAPDRYSYPILWGFYVAPILACWIYFKNNVERREIFSYILLGVCFISSFYIIFGNSKKSLYYFRNESLINTAFPRLYRYEVLLASDWLNKSINKPTLIITYEPWLMTYFTKNPFVSFITMPYAKHQQMDSIKDIIKTHNIDINIFDVYYIQQSNALSADDSFPSVINLNVRIFNNFPVNSERTDFILMNQLSLFDSWVKIYKYTPLK